MGILYNETVAARLKALQQAVKDQSADRFDSRLELQYADYDREKKEFCFTGHTRRWMENITGCIHGGICASLADQAMGIVAYGLQETGTVAPISQMQMYYHRPLPSEEPFVLKVRIVDASKHLIHLAAELYCLKTPEAVIFSSTATYFRK